MLELHIVGLFLSLKTKTSHSVNTFLTSRPYECHLFFSDFLDFKVILLIYLRLLPVKIHIPLKLEKKDILSVYPDTLFAEKFFRLPFAVNFNFHFIRKKKIKGEKWLLLEWLITLKKKKKKYPGARIFVFSTFNLTFSLSLRHQRISKYSSLFAIFLFFFSCRFFRVPYFHYHLHFYFRCALGFGEIELEGLPGKIFHRDNWISRLDFMIYGINIILVKIVIWA